ncbi:hypothetical protein [Ammoniphilus sp. 3BR4]|uniref:hypothetical protein n=1 Tax=Ammoniphilus sp. 3BR4 TaxID=3158265 RepID=UPI0034655BE7
MIFGFGTLILIGTFLLMLPIATEEGHRLGFIAGIFTMKNSQGKWLCAIDNSYGTELINK